MVIDTSALLAIFLGEPDRQRFLNAIIQTEQRWITAANALETGIVLEARRGEAAGRELDLFLNHGKIDVIAVDAEQIEFARMAWRRYGKGNHRAALNFGDCFAYALAKLFNAPLLAKGADFAHTDLELA